MEGQGGAPAELAGYFEQVLLPVEGWYCSDPELICDLSFFKKEMLSVIFSRSTGTPDALV